MNRRSMLLRGVAFGLAALSMGRAATWLRTRLDPPRFDEAWPIDVRPGYTTLARADSLKTQVLLEGAVLRGVVAVCTESGSVLVFAYVSTGTVTDDGDIVVLPLAPGVVNGPCPHAPGECLPFASGGVCYPYTLMRGRVEVQRI